MEANTEEQRIQMGTDSRNALEKKYRLAEDPRYEDAKNFQREITHEVATELKQASTPQEFGRLIDEKVVEPVASKFGNETPDSYGSRLKAAFLERMGEKARDEISLALSVRGVQLSFQNQETLNSLSESGSAVLLSNKLETLLNSPEISSIGDKQQIFESIRNSKVDEFEAFNQREAASA